MARLTLDQLSKKISYDKSSARKSLAWFEDQIAYLKNQVSPASLMSAGNRMRGSIIPGQMYLYFYRPKHMDTLPYYDTFPLVIPFSRTAETFTGLNFHYLPPKIRLVLLKNLLDFSTDSKLTERTRLRLSWDYIGGISKYRGVSVAVKSYRYDHVDSQFLFVPADQWFNAVMLPMERFNTGKNMVYVDKKLVWKDTNQYLI
jgi:hypothetical protein